MSFAVELIVVGRMKKNSPFFDLFHTYVERLTGSFKMTELEGHNQTDELQKIIEKINPQACLVALDEKGKTLPSIDFAKQLENFQTFKNGTIQFVIGGADGLDDNIRNRADLVLSFGRMTWPHMMARVMVVEQIYRAQQILVNHPYHRE